MTFSTETVGSLLASWARKTPDKEFIVYADRDLRFSYADFDERVDQLAKGLLAIGLVKGDHLGIWANNVPDWLTVLFATARIGVVLVTVNTNYKLHELEYIIRQSDMKALCIVDGFRDSDYVAMVRELVWASATKAPHCLPRRRQTHNALLRRSNKWSCQRL